MGMKFKNWNGMNPSLYDEKGTACHGGYLCHYVCYTGHCTRCIAYIITASFQLS